MAGGAPARRASAGRTSPFSRRFARARRQAISRSPPAPLQTPPPVTTTASSSFRMAASHGASRSTSWSPGPGSRRDRDPAEDACQVGDTRKGQNRASIYRWPADPFGPPPSFSGPPMNENGSEHLYVTTTSTRRPSTSASPSSRIGAGSLIDPWLLNAQDENVVRWLRGHAGGHEPGDLLDCLLRRRRGGGRVRQPGPLLRLGRLAPLTPSPASRWPGAMSCARG